MKVEFIGNLQDKIYIIVFDIILIIVFGYALFGYGTNKEENNYIENIGIESIEQEPDGTIVVLNIDGELHEYIYNN